MTVRFSPTRLIFAPEDYDIDGFPASNIPISVNSEDGVVLPIQCYVLENALRIGGSHLTLEKIGYALNQWYDYLRLRDVSLFMADERHLRDFLLGGGQRDSKILSLGAKSFATGTEDNLNKFRVIRGFYDFWQNKRGRQLSSFRGITLADIEDSLFQQPYRSASKAKINFSRPRVAEPKRRRGTPSRSEAERVLMQALDQSDPDIAQKYYLIGRLALESGSRAVGISGLYVAKLLDGMQSEEAFRKLRNCSSILRDHLVPENKSLIIKTLESMREMRRKSIFCQVTNKGGGWTTIAIPIDLAIELIDYVCTTRQEMVRWTFLKKGKPPPGNVFLSRKGGRLTPGAIGDFFNRICKREGISGSFHRFRAAFCQEVVRDTYLRERARNNGRWDVETVLERARNSLGHTNTKSLRHYLNDVLAQELALGEPVMVVKSDDASCVRALVTYLNRSDNEEFRQSLHLFLRQHKIEPIPDERRYLPS